MSSSTSSPNLETEITLLVVSQDPEGFRTLLAATDRMGSYALGPVEPVVIEDVYLDTASRELGKHAWILRVRIENGNTYLTLKGPTQRTAWGGGQRTEIELPWSQESAERIMETLSGICPGLGPLAVSFGEVPAVDTLKRCGFVPVQHRKTRRDRRIVLIRGDRQPVAEFVLDRVLYCFDSCEIRHMEIEIESKDHARVEHIGALARELVQAFGQSVRPWEYGKLATGKILETLLQNKEFRDLVRPDNYLVPIVYALIESRMKRP